MLTRRTLLTTLASLPLLRWIKPTPKETAVDADGGFIVPKEYADAIEICDSTARDDNTIRVYHPMTVEECCLARGVAFTSEKEDDAKSQILAAVFEKIKREGAHS